MTVVTLPPTIDEASRLIRGQHRTIPVEGLADAVMARGWNVDRGALITRICELYPGTVSAPTTATGQTSRGSGEANPAPQSARRRSAKVGSVGRKKKRPKTKYSQDYCPTCHAFVVMSKLNGLTTIADHVNKKGARCWRSGKPFKPTQAPTVDALERRVAGSYGTGKRR
jgi:hypothetical protein